MCYVKLPKRRSTQAYPDTAPCISYIRTHALAVARTGTHGVCVLICSPESGLERKYQSGRLKEKIMKTYIITGATSGLGLSIAASLSAIPDSHVVIAVRDIHRGRAVAAKLGRNVNAVKLDLCAFNSIDAFVSSWEGPVAGLVNNAGVQIVNETRFIPGLRFEETFAVNHLAAVKLTMGLLPWLEKGRVLFIGSGTHHPNNRAATFFGFRGARFESIQKCAEGLSEKGSVSQLGMDRYATSKFLNMVTAVELGARISAQRTAFFCLDPGMMPGTGLARTAPAHLQFIWRRVLPLIARFLPDTSTPERSAEAAAWILTAPELNSESGIIFSYNCKPSTLVWEKVLDAAVGRSVVDDSLALISEKQEERKS